MQSGRADVDPRPARRRHRRGLGACHCLAFWPLRSLLTTAGHAPTSPSDFVCKRWSFGRRVTHSPPAPGVGKQWHVWENMSSGVFGVVVSGSPSVPQRFTLPDAPPPDAARRWTRRADGTPPPGRQRRSADVAEHTQFRVAPRMCGAVCHAHAIAPEERGPDPPLCQHGEVAVRRNVLRKDSPNHGVAYTDAAT